ncbi:MAG: hypothetical protein R3C25_11040 [Hyphomonadaceae bacterium]
MSEPAEYWFARRFPLGQMRSGMAPVHWKGWAVVAAFVAALAAGGLLWAWFAARGDNGRGVFAFALMSAGAALGFIRTANKKGDHVHCVADYRKGKLSV